MYHQVANILGPRNYITKFMRVIPHQQACRIRLATGSGLPKTDVIKIRLVLQGHRC